MLILATRTMGQAPGVPIVRDRGEQFEALVQKANGLRQQGKLITVETVTRQMQRTQCELRLFCCLLESITYESPLRMLQLQLP